MMLKLGGCACVAPEQVRLQTPLLISGVDNLFTSVAVDFRFVRFAIEW